MEANAGERSPNTAARACRTPISCALVSAAKHQRVDIRILERAVYEYRLHVCSLARVFVYVRVCRGGEVNEVDDG